MSGITRQSEQYGIFDNTPRPERTAREAPPESVIREYTRGQSIGEGQLNPRGIRRQHFAVNVRGMDPEEHAYATEDPYGPGPGRHYNPYAGWEPSEYDERRREAVGEDDESGYNWGPEPSGIPEGEVGPSALPFGTPIYNPRSSPYDTYTGSRLGFTRQADDGPDGDALGANLFGDPYADPYAADMFTPMYFRQRGVDPLSVMLGAKTALLPILMPGHRVGLPYKNTMIPGTVTHVRPDGQVGILWDDGQYSPEQQGDVIPLRR